NLKFLNAINVLVSARVGALQSVHDHFGGDWERAWHSDLRKFAQDETGKAKSPADFNRLKKTIDPDNEWKKLNPPTSGEKIGLVTIFDKEYPKLLTHIFYPPFLLYVKGSVETLKNKCFGVVGTRALSEYGKRATPHITLDLARAGLTIVSGLATGVDTLAHKAALEAGAKTIAVLGTGIDDKVLYPQLNLPLARKIVEKGGAVISEYAPGTHGTKFSFPQRNRIISGLSKGVLVVEADHISGAMITAKCALEQNRDVFALPGSIFSKTSEGANYLIKKGAKLVACADDILEDYGLESKKVKKIIRAENPEEEKVLAVLTSGPAMADDIIRKTGLTAPQANATLMIMEIGKKIKNLGGGKFVLYE
ncbi:MAG: DNA-processing protein DprA, partial [Patescibacteria group bacterium]